MRNVEQLIDEALDAEERELLRSIGEEPGYFAQIGGMFAGKTGWMSMVLLVAQTVAFVAGVWAAFNFFAAEDAVTALRWGLPAAVLILGSLVVKLSMWPVMHTNRVMA
jgi:hypothetical protein